MLTDHAGRRVLVSRKWTGKTLADHKNDRRAFVLNILGVTPESDSYPGPEAASRVAWEYAKTTDPDVPPLSRRLLLAIAQRQRWRTQYRAARDAPSATDSPDDSPDLSATGDPDASSTDHPAA